MEITTEQNVQMKNVLSFRAQLDQKGLESKRIEINNVMNRFGVRPIHPAVTANFGPVDTDQGRLIDMEILTPINKDISHEIAIAKIPGYRFKPEFLLTNAVRAHIEGAGLMEDAIKELYKFIQVRNLRPITALYTFFQNEPDDPKDLIIDLMIGVDPNIL